MPCLKPANREKIHLLNLSIPKLETKLLLHKSREVIFFESLAYFPVIRKE